MTEDEAAALRARVAELEALVLALCDRILAAHEILARRAERKDSK